MTTITIQGALYYDTSGTSMMAWGTPYRWMPGKPQEFGEYVPVCAHDITADIGDFDPRPKQIKSLQEQREELHAKFAAAVREIDRRLSELQAIEYSPAEAA